ncbi:MAG TPA: tetratricopeptide repeat protein [Pseudomonadales bacterium]|nr:tetratricopeptide repeat protein [Pseudomonadales bacterium]
MLTTKNERKGQREVPSGTVSGRNGALSLVFHFRFLVFLAVIGLLAGCSPAGTHALLKGKKLLDEGNYADAVDEFKSATEDMPTNAVAWNYLGIAQQHAGQGTDAAQSYQHALELDRDLTEAHYNLGCLWLEQNRPDDAISEFTAYTLRRDKTPEGWLKLGEAQLRAKNTLSAEKSFSTANSLDPYNAEALNGLGLARMQRDRPDEAEKFFQAAVQHHADYAPAILNLATVAHLYMHDDRLALEQYKNYLAFNPRQANWDQVSAIVTAMEQAPTMPTQPPPRQTQTAQPPGRQSPPRTEAQAQSQETPPTKPPEQRQEITPPRNNYYPPREQTQTVHVQPEQTIATAQPPTQQNYSAPQPVKEPDMYTSVQPTPPQPVHDYNPLHWFRSQPTQSDMKVTPLPPEHAYTTPKPVHIVPPSPPAYPSYLYLSPHKPAAGDRHAASQMFERARQDEQQGKFTDAMNDYRLATRDDPAWFEAQYNCGVMAYRLRDYQFALQSYELALAIQPDSADARYNFALALKAAGYVPDAVKELRKISAANPNNVRAHLELGNLYAQYLYDIPHAREQYLKVLQLDPANPQASNIQFWLSANPQ